MAFIKHFSILFQHNCIYDWGFIFKVFKTIKLVIIGFHLLRAIINSLVFFIKQWHNKVILIIALDVTKHVIAFILVFFHVLSKVLV